MTGETFGQMLRAHRIRAELSQNALARAAGIDPAYVNRIEKGIFEGHVRRGVVLSLANVLEMSDALTDRFLFAAGLAPQADYQTRAEAAEAKLDIIRQAFDLPPEVLTFPRRLTG
jgi:transcriptional regulator with XRE-family HTH domain